MKKNKIYLDYSAATPVDKAVMKKMMPYFSEKFGNPLTIHNFGEEAAMAIWLARNETAEFLGCGEDEIIFTSGATESNNLAIKGVLAGHGIKGKPHIITSKIEHKSVLGVCKKMEKDGLAEVTYLSVASDGIIDSRQVKEVIKDNTVLISVMYVNNEIGTIQPIKEIGKVIKDANAERSGKGLPEIIFHTDATQAINYLDCNVEKLGVNLLSLSAHKFYGPKGVGILYRKMGVKLKPLFIGGGHEMGLRSGTHNVPGIVGLGEAIKSVKGKKAKAVNKKIKELRDYMIKRVLAEIPHSYFNGSRTKRIPGNANFRFTNAEGESIIMSLNMFGIAAGTGSACSSGSLEPSHVLLALGLKKEESHGSLRIAMGKYTTKKEIDYTINILKKEVSRLRKISGDVLNNFK